MTDHAEYIGVFRAFAHFVDSQISGQIHSELTDMTASEPAWHVPTYAIGAMTRFGFIDRTMQILVVIS